jgi:hypothetical protein
VELHVVAITGEVAPGIPESARWFELSSPVAISPQGKVAFSGHLTGPGITDNNRSGIWHGDATERTLIARNGDPAPGRAGATFTVFGDIVLGQNEALAFQANVASTSLPQGFGQGNWARRQQTTRLVALTGQTAPGQGPGATIASALAPFVLDDGVKFEASLVGGGVTAQSDFSNWRYRDNGSIELILREGQTLQTDNGNVFLGDFAHVTLAELGHMTITASIRGSNVDQSNDRGIWSNREGPLQLIFREGAAAPDLGQGVLIKDLFNSFPSNRHGQIVVGATLRDPGSTASEPQAVWTDANGAFQAIAQTGGAVPGIPGGRFGTSFGRLAINDNGQIAIQSSVINPITPLESDATIWLWDAVTGFTQVLTTHEQVSSLPAGQFFQGLGNLSLNNRGQLMLATTLKGSGVNEFNEWVLAVINPDRSTTIVAREGDEIEIAPGDHRTFSSFFELSLGGQYGRLQSFNDNGQIAFIAKFTDGTKAVILSDPVPVPEPPTWAMLVSLATIVVCTGFGRRTALN